MGRVGKDLVDRFCWRQGGGRTCEFRRGRLRRVQLEDKLSRGSKLLLQSYKMRKTGSLLSLSGMPTSTHSQKTYDVNNTPLLAFPKFRQKIVSKEHSLRLILSRGAGIQL
jgi:hypothetical protein